MSQELEFEPDGGAPSLSPPGKWGNDQPAFSSKSDSTRGDIISRPWNGSSRPSGRGTEC